MKFKTFVESLNSTNSILDKKEIIKNFLEEKEDHNFLKMYYHWNSTNFGKKMLQKAKDKFPEKFQEPTNLYDTFPDEIGNFCSFLTNRIISGNAAISTYAELYANLNENERMVLDYILTQNKIGTSLSTINKVCEKLTGEEFFPEFKCMLASKASLRKEIESTKADTFFIEEKYDGIRLLVFVDSENSIVEAYTRNGNRVILFDFFDDAVLESLEKQVKGKYVLDGEITYNGFFDDHTKQRQKISGLMNKAIKGTANEVDLIDRIVFNVFDMVDETSFYEESMNLLDSKFNVNQLIKNDYIIKAKYNQYEINPNDIQDIIALESEIDKVYQKYIEEGKEGIIIKNACGNYERKRSRSWIKKKSEQSVDLTIVDMIEGNGKYVDLLGALVCEGIEDGKKIEVKVGTGLKDHERKNIWDNKEDFIGKTAEINYNEIIEADDGSFSLFLPVFKLIREDK
jgi:DNA ligase-1